MFHWNFQYSRSYRGIYSGLSDYAPNLKESGIHGALIAMDGNFRAEDLALALRIPNNHPVSVRDGFELSCCSFSNISCFLERILIGHVTVGSLNSKLPIDPICSIRTRSRK